MKIKITVEVADIDGEIFKEAQKVLLLAQKGIIEKYAARLMSAGATSNTYIHYAGHAFTFMEISNEDQSIEVK